MVIWQPLVIRVSILVRSGLVTRTNLITLLFGRWTSCCWIGIPLRVWTGHMTASCHKTEHLGEVWTGHKDLTRVVGWELLYEFGLVTTITKRSSSTGRCDQSRPHQDAQCHAKRLPCDQSNPHRNSKPTSESPTSERKFNSIGLCDQSTPHQYVHCHAKGLSCDQSNSHV